MANRVVQRGLPCRTNPEPPPLGRSRSPGGAHTLVNENICRLYKEKLRVLLGRNEGGWELLLPLVSGFRLNMILMSQWHLLGWHGLTPFVVTPTQS